MLEMDFVNDMKDNYLAIKCTKDENFFKNMIIENDIPYFLPAEKRCLNGEYFLYYKITGKQTLQAFWNEKQITRGFFEDLLEALKAVIRNAQDYFLPESKICLQPDKIFWNYENEKVEFVYLPEYEGEADWTTLADFLVDRINYNDEELVDLALKFYEQVGDRHLMLDDFFVREDAAPYLIEQENVVCNEDLQISPNRERDIEICPKDNADENMNFNNESDNEIEEKRQKRKFLTWEIIVWLMSVLLTSFITYLSGKIYLPGVCVMLALSVFLFGKNIYQCNKEDVKREQRRKTINQAMLNGEWEDQEKETDGFALGNEKTIYMDLKEAKRWKLYGTGTYKKYKFDLSELPCTIGKDKNLVTHVIPEQTISRMHVRFFEEEEKLWLQDLNSTNGTYQNGIRLRPNQKIPVEAEDELIFGGVSFMLL